MRSLFPLFQSHIDFAHFYWSRLIQTGDSVIDATCGNGYDTLQLCQLALAPEKGAVYAFDIQQSAIQATESRLKTCLCEELLSRVFLEKRCHSHFPEIIAKESITLVAYNLGYLPGGDKTQTTAYETTMQSIRAALVLLKPGGVLSITCYIGHEAGKREREGLLEEVNKLDPQKWSCSHHTWLNRRQAPSLLLIQRSLSFTSKDSLIRCDALS